MVITSKLRRHKVMERAMRALMGNNLPPRFKFKDTYDSIEVPTAYQQHLQSQATLEAKFDELIAEEETEAPTTQIKADMVVSSNLEVGTSNLLVDTETGNVGIGTTSPGIILDVGSSLSNPQIGRNYALGSLHEADKRDSIYFGRWDGTGRDFLGMKCRVDTHTDLGYGDYSNQTKLEFYTWGNNYASSREVMCIRGDGNVGIGTASPGAPLQITATGDTKTTGTPATNGLYVYNPTNSANQDACIAARVAGTSAGDPFVSFDVAGEAGWCMGMDNSDSNKFKICNNWNNLDQGAQMTINTSGNVGIGVTNPGYKLDVNGTIQTPLLNVNGTTMSKAPRVIHIDDTRSGCPPTWAANTPIMQYSLTLSRTAYVYVSVTTILDYSSRVDCYIYFNNSVQQSHLTATDNTAWNPVNITAGGSLGAGTHTIKFQCSRANVVGCGSQWGGMQILVFEQ